MIKNLDMYLSTIDSININIDKSMLMEMLNKINDAGKPVVLFPFNNYCKYILNLYKKDIICVIDNMRNGWTYRGMEILDIDKGMEMGIETECYFCCSAEFKDELVGQIKAHRNYNGQIIYYFPERDKYKKNKDPYEDLRFYHDIRKEMAYRGIITMLDDKKLFTLLEMLKACQGIEGAVLEYGVWLGGSAFAIAKALDHMSEHKILILADLFEKADKNSAYSIMCLDEIRSNLSFYNNCIIKQINLEKNPDYLEDKKFCFIHYDAPFNEGVIRYMHESLVPGGIIVIDNYNNTIGNHALFDRWFTEHALSVPVFSPGNINQGIFLKKY